MAQYKTGSVTVTNGSQTVTGLGTLWSSEVSSGDIFTVVGENAWYEIGSVDSDTQITLSASYAGVSASGAAYAITRDFTTNYGWPYPQKGDIETASLIKRAFEDIDAKLVLTNTDGDVTVAGDITLSAGTDNGVAYLNGSKVLTSGSALTFDGGSLVGAGKFQSQVLRIKDASYSEVYFSTADTGGNGAISYNHSANAMAFYANGSEQMRLTSTGLGIGTSSPAAKLDVNGTAITRGTTSILGGSALDIYNAAGNAYTRQIVDGSNNFKLTNTTGASLIFGTNNTDRLTLDSSGNLGLGVTPSAWSSGRAIEIYAGITVGGWGMSAGYGDGFNIHSNAYYNAGWKYAYTSASAAPTRYNQTNGIHSWYTAPSGTAGNAISFSQVMTLDASGRLLIGTTSASGVGNSTLGVASAGAVYSGQFSIISQITNTADASAKGVLFGYNNSSNSGIISSAYGNGTESLAFWTHNGSSWGERARIDSSGNVGIGTSSPTEKLTIAGNIASSTSGTFYLDGTNPGSAGNPTYSWVIDTNTGMYRPQADTLGLATNGTERARIDSSGNLLVGKTADTDASVGTTISNAGWIRAVQTSTKSVFTMLNSTGSIIEFRYNTVTPIAVGSISTNGTTTAYNTSSDYRLKDNIQDITGSGAFIDALQPRTWNWKANGSVGAGFIAHELQAVSPSSVVGEKDAVDADGNPEYQAVEYGSAEVIAMLVAEVKSLRARLTAAGL